MLPYTVEEIRKEQRVLDLPHIFVIYMLRLERSIFLCYDNFVIYSTCLFSRRFTNELSVEQSALSLSAKIDYDSE